VDTGFFWKTESADPDRRFEPAVTALWRGRQEGTERTEDGRKRTEDGGTRTSDTKGTDRHKWINLVAKVPEGIDTKVAKSAEAEPEG
jgi:hypothetical protein